MGILEKLDTASRIPLSMQQDFLCLFDKGDEAGPFGPRYHIVDGWRLRGRLDVDALRSALDDVVARHEALRTTIVRGDDVRYQEVMPPGSPALVIGDIGGTGSRDIRAEEFLNAVEAETIDARELPVLRAVVGRFDDRDAVLVLVVHHTAADAWSMHVIMRDLAVCYARRRGHDVPDLPEVVQYREFAIHQRASAGDAAEARARGYWRDELRGAEIVAIATDHPTDPNRSADASFYTGWHRFVYETQLRAATAQLASAMRSSPFMVLLAAFAVFVNRMTGATDVVTPTFMPGRGQRRMQNTVGSFFNFVPLRIDLAGCATFRDVVERARATCLGAYAHEVPLALVLQEAPGLMRPVAEAGRVPCVFQVVQSPFMLDRDVVGDVEYSSIWRRTLSQPVGSDIPDGMLWSLQLGPTDDIVGQLGFSSSLFDGGTVTAMVAEFRRVLGEVVAAPDAPLSGI